MKQTANNTRTLLIKLADSESYKGINIVDTLTDFTTHIYVSNTDQKNRWLVDLEVAYKKIEECQVLLAKHGTIKISIGEGLNNLLNPELHKWFNSGTIIDHTRRGTINDLLELASNYNDRKDGAGEVSISIQQSHLN